MKQEYKSFTPITCMACGRSIYDDIHDDLCLDCLGETFPEWDEDDFNFIEEYID